MTKRALPRVVITLGFASLLTDVSSEMIYPLLPLFLSQVLGAGAIALGVIEGAAEAVASLFKIVSGHWTDRLRRRVPFIIAGYGLAGVARPLIGLAWSWPVVFALRFADRIGKGLRTAPRDALIADAVAPEERGRAYGFHRAMDHTGAMLGPIVAAVLMSWFGFSLRSVFLCAAVPAVLVMAVLLPGAREPAPPPRGDSGRDTEPNIALGRGYWSFIAAVVLFTLGNSSDAFILLRLSEAGISAPAIALLWSVHHALKMLASYYGGALSDRVGRRQLILAGWILYALVYAGFGFTSAPAALIALFLVYSIYYGCCEPVERALVADLAPARGRGAAMGYYHGAVGLAALPASLVFGGLYQAAGAGTAFLFGAACAIVASAVFAATLPRGKSE